MHRTFETVPEHSLCEAMASLRVAVPRLGELKIHEPVRLTWHKLVPCMQLADRYT